MRSLRVVAVLLFATGAFGQMRETVNVNVVEVPVTVVDASGNPIRGLTAANFELLDQGKKREISSFDKIDFAASDTSAISPLNPSARRSFLLLFDLGFSAPKSLQRAQEAARKFVADSVQPRDLIAVGNIDVEKGFRLLSAFTTDRQLTESSIADPAGFKGSDPLQIANQASFNDLANNDRAPAVVPDNERAAVADAEILEAKQRMNRGNAAYVRQRVERHVDALGQLARTLRAVPGRKQVILLSEGFDASVLQGRDARAGTEQRQENEAIMRGEVWNVDSDARFGSSTSMSLLDHMAQYFRQSDVVLHAMDIQGVRVQNDVQSGAQINSNAGLFVLSRPTGGSVFQNANDLKTNFARLLHEQEVVYVLGFQAPTTKPGTFHDVKVRLVNVPGGARVSHRAGYFETGGETPVERALSTAEIIVNDIPQGDVRVSALAASFPTSANVAQVPVILDLNGNDLARDARGGTATTEIYIYAFDSDGVVRDRLYQKLTLDMKKIGEKMKATGLRYYGTLALPPGRYAVKSLVRSGEDKRGFARANVTVARANELAVTPPIPIDEDPKWVLVKGNSHAPATATNPFDVNGQLFVPSADAHFGQKLAFYVRGVKPEDLIWETTPKTKFLGQASANGGATAMVLQLDSGGNASQLDVKVQKKGSPETQQASVTLAK